MKKPFLLFRGPVKTRSGYGSHSRDLLQCLYELNLFDIKIDSCLWGSTPTNALEDDNVFHEWIKQNIATSINQQPDIYVQVTVPNEFNRLGKFNIGITAGIETTVAPSDWIIGCNRMDLIITVSEFSKKVLVDTKYNEQDKNTGVILSEHKVNKPIEVLFEGVDTKIHGVKKSNINLDIKEDFCFLFVGHWLRGILGQDRKDVGMLIRCFCIAFDNKENKPALILKTSSATFSVRDREHIRMHIESIVKDFINPPSIYLLFGDLTENEMVELYNHEKIKTMISLTKGEGFGRPLLEFSMTGKPVIVSNWGGHLDFLNIDESILIGGSINNVHESAVDQFILKDSQWFTCDYQNAVDSMIYIKKNYESFLNKSKNLGLKNRNNFSLDKMKEKFKEIIEKYVHYSQEYNIILPKLNKIS